MERLLDNEISNYWNKKNIASSQVKTSFHFQNKLQIPLLSIRSASVNSTTDLLIDQPINKAYWLVILPTDLLASLVSYSGLYTFVRGFILTVCVQGYGCFSVLYQYDDFIALLYTTQHIIISVVSDVCFDEAILRYRLLACCWQAYV